MRHAQHLSLLAGGLLYLTSCYATAFQLIPMSMDYQIGKQNNQSFSVINDSDQPRAVKIELLKREMDSAGKETLSPAPEIGIFPTQFILPAKQNRLLRILPHFTAPPEIETTYRVIAEELPVNLDAEQKKTGVSFRFKYVASLYFPPALPLSSVQLLKVETLSDGKGLQFFFNNGGNSHSHLENLTLTLKQKTQSITFDKIAGLGGENLFAQHQRSFIWHPPKEKTTLFNFKQPLEGVINFGCESCPEPALAFPFQLP